MQIITLQHPILVKGLPSKPSSRLIFLLGLSLSAFEGPSPSQGSGSPFIFPQQERGASSANFALPQVSFYSVVAIVVFAATLARNSPQGALGRASDTPLSFPNLSWPPGNGHRFWLSPDVHSPCLCVWDNLNEPFALISTFHFVNKSSVIILLA